MLNRLNPQKTWLRDIVLLFILVSSCFSFYLGQRPLSVPDEARYSEIPREILISGDYVTPHLNGIKYFEKPPLLYWLQAASLKTFGVNELAARIPNMLFGVLGCLIVYAATRSLYNRRSAWLASLILASSLMYFGMAHTVTTDMLMTLCMTATFSSFLVAVNTSDNRKRRLLFYITYMSAGFAVLTKGLVGVLLPGLVVFCWLLLCQQWTILKRIYLISGILLFLVIAAPWHYLVQQANPEFAQFYFLDQQFARYLTMYAQRYQPVWFFIPILLAGLFPWIVFLPQALHYHFPKSWSARGKYKNSLFFILWIVLIFIFYSCSKSKLIPYLLPIFPALAILIGTYLNVLLNQSDHTRLAISFKVLALLCILIGLASITIPHFVILNEPTLAKYSLAISGIIFTSMGLTANYYYSHKQLSNAIISLFIGAIAAFCCMIIAIPAVDTRSIKPLVMTLNANLHTNEEVMSYGSYYQDLPFYLQQPVTIVHWKNELQFGLDHQPDAKIRMIGELEFLQRWQSPRKIYMIVENKRYQELNRAYPNKFHLLQQTVRNSLVSN